MTVHKLADGCCSARTPCGHQCKDPTTICDACRAASPSVAAWLAEQEEGCRERAQERLNAEGPDSPIRTWHLAQAAAFEAAHAYTVARPDRTVAPTRLGDPARPAAVPDIADADLAYLAGLAISSKDATLARIAAALLLAR